jgi:sortase A
MKTLLRRTLLLVILLGYELSLGLVFHFIHQGSTLRTGPLTATAHYEQEKVNAGLPVRLKIPGINIDAAVEYVGLTPEGTMDVPKGPDDVAWFERGQRPGERGSAVMAGHYDLKNGEAGPFDNLRTLRPGDKVYVEDDTGEIISFVVRESRTYDPKADASDVFGSHDGKAHLNLITCEGEWDTRAQQYSKRLVVFTDKE